MSVTRNIEDHYFRNSFSPATRKTAAEFEKEQLREEIRMLRDALARSEQTVIRQQELLRNAQTRELELRQQLAEALG